MPVCVVIYAVLAECGSNASRRRSWRLRMLHPNHALILKGNVSILLGRLWVTMANYLNSTFRDCRIMKGHPSMVLRVEVKKVDRSRGKMVQTGSAKYGSHILLNFLFLATQKHMAITFSCLSTRL